MNSPLDSLSLDDRLKLVSQQTGVHYRSVVLVYQSIPRTDSPQLSLDGANPRTVANVYIELARAALLKLSMADGDSLQTIDNIGQLGVVLRKFVDEKIVTVSNDDFFEELDELHSMDESLGVELKLSRQWSLSTMIVATIFVAIITAGYARMGPDGVIGALVATGLSLAGALALYDEFKDYRAGEYDKLKITVAALTVLAGLFTFFSM